MPTLAEMLSQLLRNPQQGTLAELSGPSIADMLRSPAQSALSDLGSGIAPGGLRHSGDGVKGMGYFGNLPHAGGSRSTELSSSFDHGGREIEHPLLVPTLDAAEIAHLLSGAEPTTQIYDKAQSHALHRISKGLSPFAGPSDLRYPMPK